ncbi:hypothetical protein PRZ48_014035 [Zasmidium cellare]|uniref:Uncharacterized protein n=1 Tax=Zasmidium cellare TaxID=395010 RepID=A0ABR0DZU7_ZASCE|nr:hypothetical protein PRZ48_014035 [Zasmidium cellare]
MEPAYAVFYTPIVPQGAHFSDEHLVEVMREGHSACTHEPLQRYASEDFAKEKAGSTSPEVHGPRDNSLDHAELPPFTYSATPLPGLPAEPRLYPNPQEAQAAFSPSSTVAELPEGVEDDREELVEKKQLAVKLLYKAICSMPVRVDDNSSTRPQVQDTRTTTVNDMLTFLAPYPDRTAYAKLSALAELLYRDIVKLHSQGYDVNVPLKYRKSDKQLTAVQRLEMLIKYLSDMKDLVLKRLREGVDGIAEVVAFPKTLFEQYLNGEVGDSGDEEEVGESDEVDEQETASAEAVAPVLPATTSTSTPAVPTSPASTRRPRRRLRPKMASNFP